MGQVSAVDLDSPPYNSFTYRLRSDDPDSAYFLVDGATGNIRTAMPLDRERRRMYRMSVIAQSDTVRHVTYDVSEMALNQIYTAFRKKNTHSRFLSYLRGKCLYLHEIFRVRFRGIKYSVDIKISIHCYR